MFSRILVVAIVIFLIVTFLSEYLPDWLTFSLIAVLSGGYAFYEYKRRIRTFIDLKIGSIVGFRTKFQMYSIGYAQYRYVDIYNAVSKYISEQQEVITIETTNEGFLPYFMDMDWFGDDSKKITKGSSIHFKISYDEEVFVPRQRIWVIKKGEKDFCILHIKFHANTYLDVACLDEKFVDELMDIIYEDSVKNSIYKNKLLSLTYDNEIQEDEGSTIQYRDVNITFLPPKTMTEESIVLEEEIAHIIKRNIFDFFAQKDKLAAQHVPLHRGLLFYGSPGTGKTYTCHYIYHTLKNATCIVASGNSLMHIKSVCNLARMLQPALVILEDVDLVFASREVNAYGGTLGELMDQLDGFKADDNIIFILTTNTLDRIESAIKDRPGRINQIIHFDVPTKNLRLKYFQNYLLPYDTTNLDVSELAQKVEGVSQAFIKDLVFRAVQIALEESNYQDVEKVCLQMNHFDIALREIIKYNNQAAYAILKYKDDIL
ncbi:MAG: ATP-binding protein [Cytophagales bacterium]|nr:MAG: ATP-binding protein [Cytophagales bacterium]